jgi:hypothetical protein
LLIQFGEQFSPVSHLVSGGKHVKSLLEEDVQRLRICSRFLQRLESYLNIFKEDHKIFKGKFSYDGKDQYLEVPRL